MYQNNQNFMVNKDINANMHAKPLKHIIFTKKYNMSK